MKLSEFFNAIKYFLLLLVASKTSILKLSEKKYFMGIISVFFIIIAIGSIAFNSENISNNIFFNMFQLFLYSIIYYSFNLLFKGKIPFKSIVQIMACIAIIEGTIFRSIGLLTFILPFIGSIIWSGIIIAIVEIFWECLILVNFGKYIGGFNMRKAILISVSALIIIGIADITFDLKVYGKSLLSQR